jgi:O-antigen ligase
MTGQEHMDLGGILPLSDTEKVTERAAWNKRLVHAETFGSVSFSISFMLVFLPWFAVPGLGRLPVPLAAGVLILIVLLHGFAGKSLVRKNDEKYPLRIIILYLFGYWSVSAIFGWLNLYMEGKDILRLTIGNVYFIPVVLQRLLLLLLCGIAFEIMRSRAWNLLHTLLCWLLGLSIAVLIHFGSSLFAAAEQVQRGGLFAEGNHAGLYYLLSFFVALEYRRQSQNRLALVFIGLALLGLLLSRSSAAFLIFVIAMWCRQLLRARSLFVGLRSALFSAVVVAGMAWVFVAFDFDFGLAEKLFEEDVTAASFSRIDRLASIDAAFRLFAQSPALGHGLQSYEFLSNNLLEGTFAYAYDGSYRRIANNVYAEIAAELGILGLLIMALLLFFIMRTIYRNQIDKERNFLAATIGMLIYWCAFPSYAVIYLWVFLGLACNSRSRLAVTNKRSQHVSPGNLKI